MHSYVCMRCFHQKMSQAITNDTVSSLLTWPNKPAQTRDPWGVIHGAWPDEQRQSNDPSVFSHSESPGQLWSPVIHSFTSETPENKYLQNVSSTNQISQLNYKSIMKSNQLIYVFSWIPDVHGRSKLQMEYKKKKFEVCSVVFFLIQVLKIRTFNIFYLEQLINIDHNFNTLWRYLDDCFTFASFFLTYLTFWLEWKVFLRIPLALFQTLFVCITSHVDRLFFSHRNGKVQCCTEKSHVDCGRVN